jgi:hypothetical protein
VVGVHDITHGPVGKRRWTQWTVRRYCRVPVHVTLTETFPRFKSEEDRDVVMPRASTPMAICRLNRERKAAGRRGRPGKDPTRSERQSRRQAAACDHERIGRSTSARCNGHAVIGEHGPVGKRART